MSLQGHTLCFSGTLSTQTRAQASAAAKKEGAKISSSVTGSTTALVAGPGAGAKQKQAEAKGIEIWSEDHFNSLIGIGGVAGSAKKPAAKKPAAKKPKKETATPSPKKAASAAAKTPPPAKKKIKLEPATPGTPGSGGARRVLSCVQDASSYTVFEDYDVKLMLSDSFQANSNKFYKLQLLQSGDSFYVATNWGRLGEPGKSQVKGPHDLEGGIVAFRKVFRSKTKNDWGAPFERHDDKYQIVETLVEDGEGGGDADAALGRLTEAQIVKGQAVLKEIRAFLEEDDKAAASGKRKRKKSQQDRDGTLGQFSNDFYSLIPTTSGRQRPPRLDNLEIVTEKEGLLEFWLRMGFEEVSSGGDEGSPIDGVFNLPVPTTLKSAALGISDQYSVSSSVERGSELASEQAGDPLEKMSKEHYGAILLYTGNSIYRELNRCLRTEWKSVPKYWKYLRLYFEASRRMPTEEKTLWRGIAADLYSEYEVGKVITWWTVSSCTADQNVAENFMNQLGGSDATLLTLHTKSACDIASLSFYPHEQESLLKPGTKLRVLKRTKKGKVAHIEVEEVIEEEENKKPAAKQ
mmetsp:Transcript_3763/g.6647  ORF Transcript_3763/g.6647 Transcript_3763/m.6647 type:complete len:576 (-) Transcript_3763:913-2640(-)